MKISCAKNIPKKKPNIVIAKAYDKAKRINEKESKKIKNKNSYFIKLDVNTNKIISTNYIKEEKNPRITQLNKNKNLLAEKKKEVLGQINHLDLEIKKLESQNSLKDSNSIIFSQNNMNFNIRNQQWINEKQKKIKLEKV